MDSHENQPVIGNQIVMKYLIDVAKEIVIDNCPALLSWDGGRTRPCKLQNANRIFLVNIILPVRIN